jgi:2'-5' RNA ligase
MRLFFALWPSEEVRVQLGRWSRELHSLCGGHRMAPQNLHLTLAFLGEVEAARVADVGRAADEVAVRRDSLALDWPGYWRHNRIVWAGTSSVPAGIGKLAQSLREALARHEIGFDPKPFATHVTLLRNAREPKAMPVLEPIRWNVEGFVLACSQRQERGSRYEVLGSWSAAN